LRDEDLLRGFIHEDWVKELDFSTLEVFKDSFVSDNLLERHDDIIWRVRWGKKKWLYVYLLFELSTYTLNIQVFGFFGMRFFFKDFFIRFMLNPKT